MVYETVEALRKHGISKEGIFRASGNKTAIADMREAVERMRPMTFTNVHDCGASTHTHTRTHTQAQQGPLTPARIPTQPAC